MFYNMREITMLELCNPNLIFYKKFSMYKSDLEVRTSIRSEVEYWLDDRFDAK